MFKFFQKKKTSPRNLKEVLGVLKNLEERLKKTDKKLQILEKNSKFFLQKVGIIRFNPFPEVGGNQSFSIALLDNNNDGLVITSLYSREENRVYGKPIKRGESTYHLSKEEKEAIKKAKTQNEKRNSKKSNNSSTNSSGFRPH